MGYAQAAELLILGDFFGAEKAQKVGLVNEVNTDADGQALKVAQKLAAKPPAATRNAKAMLKKDYWENLDQIVVEEIAKLSAMVSEPECQEALAAFAEKRAPDFSQF